MDPHAYSLFPRGRRSRVLGAVAAVVVAASSGVSGARLEPADFENTGPSYGDRLDLSGSSALIGATTTNDGTDGLFLFRNLPTATGGRITETLRLAVSPRAGSLDLRGLSLSGSIALALEFRGINDPDDGIFLFRNLDAASGTATESARIDGVYDYHAQSGNVALAIPVRGSGESADALVFRGLDDLTGLVPTAAASLRLLPSSLPGITSVFGESASMDGPIALVGVGTRWYETNPSQGTGVDRAGLVYVFRGVTTATGTINESARLLATNMILTDDFGAPLSLSGTTAIVAAPGDEEARGTVYLFRNLDSITGEVTEQARLQASDGQGGTDIWGNLTGDGFGEVLSLSGDTALIGAGAAYGKIYVFRNLDTASGTVTENLRILRNNQQEVRFGSDGIHLDGDRFLISGGSYFDEATSTYRKAVYTGHLSSMTMLDEGGASRLIERIGFESFDDWVIGDTTDANTVTVADLAGATVTKSGRGVFVGRQPGSDDNALIIDRGYVTASEIHVGTVSGAGSVGNRLELNPDGYDSAPVSAAAIRLAPGNFVVIHGDYTNPATLVHYLRGSPLSVWSAGSWQPVTATNAAALVGINLQSGRTVIGTDPTTTPRPPSPPVPRLTVSGPRSLTTRSATVLLRGLAANAIRVEVQVGNARFKPARGTNRWTFTARLKRGRNVIKVHAVAANGREYAEAKVTVIRR